MKLASLDDGSREGSLVVVRSDGQVYADGFEAARTMDELLEDWHTAAADLRQIGQRVELGATPTLELDLERVLPPLPRIHGWLDGAQGEPGELLGPVATIQLPPNARASIRPELCLVTSEVRVAAAAPALSHLRLVLLALCVEVDIDEPGSGSAAEPPFRRPATVFAPFATSLEGLGEAFDGACLALDFELAHDGAEPTTLSVSKLCPGGLIDAIRRVRALPSGTVLTTGAFDGPPLRLDRGSRVEIEHPAFGRASCVRL